MFIPILMLLGAAVAGTMALDFLRPIPKNDPFGL